MSFPPEKKNLNSQAVPSACHLFYLTFIERCSCLRGLWSSPIAFIYPITPAAAGTSILFTRYHPIPFYLRFGIKASIKPRNSRSRKWNSQVNQADCEISNLLYNWIPSRELSPTLLPRTQSVRFSQIPSYLESCHLSEPPLVGQSLGPSTSYIFLSAESGAEANSTKGWQYCITGPGLRVFLGTAIESVLLDVGQRTSIDLLVGCSRSTTKNGWKKSFNKNSETNHCLWYLVITT